MGKIKNCKAVVKIQKMKTWFRNQVLFHPISLVIALVVILLVIFLAACWCAVIIDLLKFVNPIEAFKFLYNKCTIETGLSILTGYIGAGVTVILGIVTLRFSFKVEERARIKQFQNTIIKKIRFYDMFDDFMPSKLRYEDIKKCRFLLEFELVGGVSDFEIQMENVWWGGCDEEYHQVNPRALNHCKTYIEKAENTFIYVYFDEFENTYDARENIAFFYHISDYEPLLLQRSMRYRWIQLELWAGESVWVEKQSPKKFMAEFKILVENKGDKKEKKSSVKLYELQHSIKI